MEFWEKITLNDHQKHFYHSISPGEVFKLEMARYKLGFRKYEDWIKFNLKEGLAKPVSFLIRKFSKPRELIIDEYVSEGGTLVDLGCGTGNFCKLAAHKFKKVYGLDFVPESVESAQKQEITNAEFQVLDLNQTPLPFPVQSIDTVVSIVTLDYVYNLNSLILEIKRILKELLEIEEITNIWRLSGDCGLFMKVEIPSIEQFNPLIEEKISQIKGVKIVETCFITDVIK